MRAKGRLMLAVAAVITLAVAAPGLVVAQVVCKVPLTEVGPVSVIHGFPNYYVDSTGLALQPCLDPVGFCPLTPPDLPNPLGAVVFPTNFPPESFYYLGQARLALPSIGGALPGQARLIMAVEGAFLNGPVVPGDQFSFGRLRIRASGLTPGASYTFTHPQGTDILQADALGTVNFTDQAGAVGFTGPLASRLGPLVVWDASLPPPPAGFIGDPAVDHAVTGSPCGQNFFRITGPGLPAAGVTTNLFSVAGKKSDICGNGILNTLEQCDDGNRVNGDCCDSNCRFEALNSPCTDADICTATACDGAGRCGITGFSPGPCSDGNVCTTGDACAATGCTPTAVLNCDDANVCTDNACVPPTRGCVASENLLACDDGNAATAADSCAGAVCMGARLRGSLALVSGENPSAPGLQAVGDARWDGTRVRLNLTNMDPARYPASAACSATVTVGPFQGTASVVPVHSGAANVTGLTFLRTGALASGSRAQVRIRCQIGGVRHETQWSGTVSTTVAPAVIPIRAVRHNAHRRGAER